MPAVRPEVIQQVTEIRVVVVQGSALIVSDVNRKDAVVVVGLDKASVIAKECELLAGFELLLCDLCEVAHDFSFV